MKALLTQSENKTNYTCFRGEKDESIVNTIGKRNTIQGI